MEHSFPGEYPRTLIRIRTNQTNSLKRKPRVLSKKSVLFNDCICFVYNWKAVEDGPGWASVPRKPQSSWLAASVRPIPGHCSYLGTEPEHGRSLILSVSHPHCNSASPWCQWMAPGLRLPNVTKWFTTPSISLPFPAPVPHSLRCYFPLSLLLFHIWGIRFIKQRTSYTSSFCLISRLLNSEDKESSRLKLRLSGACSGHVEALAGQQCWDPSPAGQQ